MRGLVSFDMPEIISNLNAGVRRTSFIKLKVKLEISKIEDHPLLQASTPRILDMFQTYLRELRPEELRGTANTYRLREELIARVNVAVHPAQIVSLLFIELIVQ